MKATCFVGMVLMWPMLGCMIRRLCILGERKTKSAHNQILGFALVLFISWVFPLFFLTLPFFMLCFAYTCVGNDDRNVAFVPAPAMRVEDAPLVAGAIVTMENGDVAVSRTRRSRRS